MPLRPLAHLAAWNFICSRVYDDHDFQEQFLTRYFTLEEREDEHFGTWFEKSEQGLWVFMPAKIRRGWRASYFSSLPTASRSNSAKPGSATT